MPKSCRLAIREGLKYARRCKILQDRHVAGTSEGLYVASRQTGSASCHRRPTMSMLALKTSPCCLARHQTPATAVAPQLRNTQRVVRRKLQLCHAADHESQTDLQTSPEPSTASLQQPEASTSGSSAPGPASVFPYNIMTALAAAGAAETIYLTVTKLLNASVACPTSGCDAVLSSPYAELYGLPLPLLGAGTYAAVGVAAALATRTASSGKHVPGWLSTGLAAGVCALAATSAYLMYILQTQLGGAPCVWCYASAGISAALFSSLIAGMDKRQMADAAGAGLGATAAAVAALYVGFGPVMGSGISNAAELELPYVQPTVTTPSSEETLSLAKRLKDAGAVMYGAFWCSHCYDQKQEFGAAAMADFPYVECFPEGWKKGVKLADACEAVPVKAFPTWVINGTITEGQLDIATLEQMLAAAQQPAAVQESAAVAAAVQ